MAVITPSAIVGDIRGSIGALTFARNRSQTIVRSKPMPRHSKSTLQIRRHATFQRARMLWQDLSAPEKLAWKMAVETLNQMARKPYAGTLSAFQFFCSCQCTEASRGFSTACSPPLLCRPCPIIVLTSIGRIGTQLTISVFAPYSTPTAYISVFGASPCQTAGHGWPESMDYRHICRHQYASFPLNILAEWTKVWGTPQYLQIGSTRVVVQQTDHLASTPIQDDFYWGS